MTSRRAQFEPGPAQLFTAPDHLHANVVDWRDGGAIHGIGVFGDLDTHYSPHEALLLALTGVPPCEVAGRAFGAAVTWVSASHIGTAPTHAAVLARISGAPTANLLAIAAMAAGQEIEHILKCHQPLLDWLAGTGGCHGEFHGDGSWRRRALGASGLDLPQLDAAHDLESAVLVVFHHVGLKAHPKIASAWIWARVIGSLAEALHEHAPTMRTYPLRLPEFEYGEKQR